MDTSRTHLVQWGFPLLVAVMLLGAQGASAQSLADDAADCILAPLELPLFGRTPVAMLPTPDSQAAEDASDASQEAIQSVLEQYVACTNTGDPTLVWAMFSPRWFATSFADPQQHYLPAFEQMLDGPQMVFQYPLELVDVHNIEHLPDGRVEVTATFRSGDRTWTDTLTLGLVDGQWLIDDVTLDAPAN